MWWCRREKFPASWAGELTLHPDTRYVDASGLYLLPGGIDEHVHFREPGLTHKGGFESESRAAVAGGVCSVLEMPNTVPQTTTRALWEAKQESAAGKMHCNYAFYIGATNHNLEEIKMADPQKVAGVKLFLGSSTGDMLLSDDAVLAQLFQWQGMPLLAHCESESLIRANTEAAKQQYGEKAPFRIHAQVRSEEACYQSSLRAGRYKWPGNTVHLCISCMSAPKRNSPCWTDNIRKSQWRSAPPTCFFQKKIMTI